MKNKKEFKGQLSDTDLRVLRIFKAVVECGGFAAAEVELNITRAAISIAMSTLETRLGFKLCLRGRSGFSLTSEGSEVYQYTLELLSAIENFRTQVNTLHANLKGELNIGITDNLVTIPYMQVSNALARLKETGPEVEINIRMIPPNEVESAVLSGGIHVGVVPDIRRLSGLEYSHLYNEKSFLYCSHRHPLAEKNDHDISDSELNGFDTVTAAYAQSAEVKALTKPFKTSASATDREGIAFLVHTGKYLGFLPEHYAARWLERDELMILQPETYHFTTPFSAISSKNVRANLVLETFMSLLNEQA
ncbi:LysR family transcriptional regulator [Endozoicomonas sp. OPT23]|uniref:LysR family transcriptional regulator n=1 Tax=Endozoicomonas sp. OPT23 TaxID=2072845 RepID=UPI00129AB9EF|nr:LysR family transcriptional regulator [Endozoicomonas sp. OPT23]MRI32647.1 LysR family transcriptional regulator [Endozoicomonas sp. OPT23]